MAFKCVRSCFRLDYNALILGSRRPSGGNPLEGTLLVRHGTRTSPIGVAYLASLSKGGPLVPKINPTPFPYKEKKLKGLSGYLDVTEDRFDENSKIIVVEGNLATGKKEIAKEIANEFGMVYVPEIGDRDLFTIIDYDQDAVVALEDIREFDEMLPPTARHSSFESFYLQQDHKDTLKCFPRMQYFLCRYKYQNYIENAVNHLLNTGQGVVMNRSFYSDLVWAKALAKTGHMSKLALEKYMYQFNVVFDLDSIHPNLVIYLDAPISMVKENIKKRNVPWEINSPIIMNDAFLHTIRDTYLKDFLPRIREHSEVLFYDLAKEDLDIDNIVLDLESLDLYTKPLDYPNRFEGWTDISDYEFYRRRKMYQRLESITDLFLCELKHFDQPTECMPELWLETHDREILGDLFHENGIPYPHFGLF